MEKKYKIIDAHSHIFPEPIMEKASESIGDFYKIRMANDMAGIQRLFEKGDEIGVDKYVVCSTATATEQVDSINAFILNEQKKYEDKLYGFGTIHPDTNNIFKVVEGIRKSGLFGIKIHPDFQETDIDDKRFCKMYEAASEYMLPVLIHMGDDRYDFSRPHRLAKVVEKFPNLNVMAAHFGGYSKWDEAAVELKESGVYVDTSSSLEFIDVEQARNLIDVFGIDKVLFGVDFPMWSHKNEYSNVLALGLSEENNVKVFAENFENLLKKCEF